MTPIELIDSIVGCDSRTRRAMKLIATLASCAAVVLLVAWMVLGG